MHDPQRLGAPATVGASHGADQIRPGAGDRAQPTERRTTMTTLSPNRNYNLTLDQIPGCASLVSGGWVWMTGLSTEHSWSKRRDRAACEVAVLEACQRLGIEAALDTDNANH